MNEILSSSLSALGYGVVGTVVMLLGYLITDLLTPGKLHQLIWEDRNPNAILLVSANTLGAAVVVVSAIMSSYSELGLVPGLVSTAVFGLIGLVVMALSFLLIDLLTPTKISHIVSNAEWHPATWVSATAHLSIALVVAAAIS
ncbi:uncharacterized membrane protein YjfL (UPF0719 family) [Nocardiopsis terrae]|uniref:Uncharacterized membrane protein YjfL (UPF0719 family) n=1 Tax=Nocardiopsis terrae TaxID=372655 RepID=A0ABR9HM86_9ACTN|nr:DUF350 domain-containing protein [Nocardiopsis terrae]MBE1460118.1 uncharacterized membrane protein YjfL (UPF0719 family) [Nocardiopsis terrae]